jgi:hypothetical protein
MFLHRALLSVAGMADSIPFTTPKKSVKLVHYDTRQNAASFSAPFSLA